MFCHSCGPKVIRGVNARGECICGPRICKIITEKDKGTWKWNSAYPTQLTYWVKHDSFFNMHLKVFIHIFKLQSTLILKCGEKIELNKHVSNSHKNTWAKQKIQQQQHIYGV